MGWHVLLTLSGRHCSFTFLLLAQTTSASGWQVSPGSSKIDFKFLFLVLLRGDKLKRRKRRGDQWYLLHYLKNKTVIICICEFLKKLEGILWLGFCFALLLLRERRFESWPSFLKHLVFSGCFLPDTCSISLPCVKQSQETHPVQTMLTRVAAVPRKNSFALLETLLGGPW